MNILTGGMKDLTGTGLQYKSSPSGGNGLLTGLTEAWEPSVTLAMVGKKTGLNTNTDAGLSYSVQAGFPAGHGLLSDGTHWPPGITLATSSSVLVSAIAITDFCGVQWCLASNDCDDNPGVVIGEDSTNGADWACKGPPYPSEIRGEIPAGDNSYPEVDSTGTPFAGGTANMLAFWYTTADNTLHTSVNAGTVFTLVNTAGVGIADITNSVKWLFLNSLGSHVIGPMYLWQGTAGSANAVSKLADLYGSKLQYSDFT